VPTHPQVVFKTETRVRQVCGQHEGKVAVANGCE
jgi:hypothetical protein